MCKAGPRPSLGCISHSFAGPVTSPPHLRHFTKRFSPLCGLAAGGLDAGVGWVFAKSEVGDQNDSVVLPVSNRTGCHGLPVHPFWYMNVSFMVH